MNAAEKRKTEAYREGMNAASCGLSQEENPYRPTTGRDKQHNELYDMWIKGFNDYTPDEEN